MSDRISVVLVAPIAAGTSGVSRYARAVIAALDEVHAEFPELDISVIATAAAADRLGALELPVGVLPFKGRVVASGPARIVTEQVAAAATRAHLLHFFDMTGPVFAPKRPFTATIHDASVMHGYSAVRQAYKRRLYPWALRRAKTVVAVSAFARDEALAHFGASAGRIVVVHSGPGLTATSTAGRSRVVPAEPFLLYVGNLTASKNLPFLVRAYERSGVEIPLLLVGRRAEGFDELRRAIERVQAGRIRLLHDASDDDVDALYRSAAALLLPSRYEGFAFTPLEAMTRGCPVIASDIPAVREVSGEGALLVALDDEAAWADALRAVVGDEGRRAQLRAAGREWVRRYSWRKTARALCGIFHQPTSAG